jgi:hypothetical protein
MEKLRIGNEEIRYSIHRTSDSKYAHLKLKPNHELEVFIPMNNRIDVKRLLLKKRRWIAKSYAEMSTNIRIFDGRQVLYKGTPYDVVFKKGSGKRNVRIDNGKIVLPIRSNEERKEALKRWMSNQTGILVRRRLDAYRLKHGLSFNGFSVKDTKRWAYCTKDGYVVFNWRLSALPRELADFVVLHEIGHLREFNHSHRFRYALATLCPDFKEKEAMLKRYVYDS